MTIRTLVIAVLLSSSALAQGSTVSEAQQLLQQPLPTAKNTNEQGTVKMPSFSCLLTPSLDVLVASPVVGVIQQVAVEKGQLVNKGDILVQLHTEVEQATLALNKAQANYGSRTIARNKKLYKNKLISAQEKDEIVINNLIYSYEVKHTQALIEQKKIRSPINGVVIDIMLDPGEYVGEEPILNAVQLDPLYVEVVLPAEYYGRVNNGDTALVMLDEPINSEHKAKVKIVDQILDAASATFAVRLELSNPNNQLPAGLKCNIQFDGKES